MTKKIESQQYIFNLTKNKKIKNQSAGKLKKKIKIKEIKYSCERNSPIYAKLKI